MSTVGMRLREMREKRGLTQKELASRILKSPATVSAYESGVQTPPTDVLVSISRVLRVPIAYLVGQVNENSILVESLTEPQKDFLNLLFLEFTSPTGDGNELSAQQVEIVRRLLLIFSRQ